MQAENEEIELLNNIAQDNIAAFEAIYNKYSQGMFMYAMNIFNQKEICEDIVQNVFIDFWSKRRERKISSLKSFLFQAVKNQIFNHFRNQKITNIELSRLYIIDSSMGISQKLEYHELENLIAQQVDKLPTRCRQIFILSRYEYRSNNEIAKELGVSVQAVKNQISKALAFMRNNINVEEVIFFFLLYI